MNLLLKVQHQPEYLKEKCERNEEVEASEEGVQKPNILRIGDSVFPLILSLDKERKEKWMLNLKKIS